MSPVASRIRIELAGRSVSQVLGLEVFPVVVAPHVAQTAHRQYLAGLARGFAVLAAPDLGADRQTD